MIEEPSLRNLLDISRRPKLSDRVNELIITTEVIEESPRMRRGLAKGGFMSRGVLLTTGAAKDLLSAALCNVRRCRAPRLRRCMLIL